MSEDYVAPLARFPVFHNVGSWLQENEKFFQPPVCNKMMYNSQLKVFYVGGPNQRKDYHMEEGEELFYMRKGDMCLKIVEGNKFKDVRIKEGQVFLLPGKLPHSPQREADTVGLVIERERHADERDGLRYYVAQEQDGLPTGTLYQRWFHCKDLGSELGPVIKGFFASQQFKTMRPIPEDLDDNPSCWNEDSQRKTEPPFCLGDWLDKNGQEIARVGSKDLFDRSKYQSDVRVLGLGDGTRLFPPANGETFLWQLNGSSKIEGRILSVDDVILLPRGSGWQFDPNPDAMVLMVQMDLGNRSRVGFPSLGHSK